MTAPDRQLPELNEDRDTTVLDELRRVRSAEVYVTARLTRSYVGSCKQHNRPVRYDSAEDLGNISTIPCPEGDHRIAARRLLGVKSKVACDGACQAATRRLCSCGCGGINHGRVWMIQFAMQMGAPLEGLSPNTTLSDKLVPADELAKWREARLRERATKRAAAERRREAGERKARASFDDWAAEHAPAIEALAPYAGDPNSGGGSKFLRDLANQVTGYWGRSRPLTEAQIDAAFGVIAAQAEREREMAEREAAKRPAPTGRQQVTGRIVKVTYDSSEKPGRQYSFAPEHKMTIGCNGYAVRVTVPRAVAEWAEANRHDALYEGWHPGSSDYEISERWTTALKGVNVTLAATIEHSKTNESFGFGSRPAQVVIHQPEPEAEAG